MNDQQSIFKIVLDPRPVDRRWKLERLFKIRIADLHLLVRNAAGTRFIFPAARQVKYVLTDIDLDLLR